MNFYTIDPYYPNSFYNECKESLKNNNVDFQEFINIKSPFEWYFRLDKEPIIVNYDKSSDSSSRWMVNIIKPLRPNEEYIDRVYEELIIYWDGIIEAVPDLKKDPASMRVHNLDPEDENGGSDHLLFWPIGQEMFSWIVRSMLNLASLTPNKLNKTSVVKELKTLAHIDWELHSIPWRNFLLVPGSKPNSWIMRSEDRAEVLKVANRLIRWMLTIDTLPKPSVDELKDDWGKRLSPPQAPELIDKMWNVVVNKRSEIAKMPY